MRLPSADLGLMAEHLATHEGMINKLKMYYVIVSHSVFKKLIGEHIEVLRQHGKSMLELINPNQVGPFQLNRLEEINLNNHVEALSEQEKDISLEVRATAKSMAADNFSSALMMQDKYVRLIHIEMALQEVRLQSLYDEIIRQTNGDFTPKAADQMQQMTVEKYKHVLDE